MAVVTMKICVINFSQADGYRHFRGTSCRW